MFIEENKQLAAFTTFGLPSIARYYFEARSCEDLREALLFAKRRKIDAVLLGGGSNVVLAPSLNCLVIRVMLGGIEVTDNIVKVKAGENWHSVVLATLGRGLFGLENLSLIPGSVGAAPIQNIGAYGVEIESVISAVTVLDRQTLDFLSLDVSECKFGYRTSIFKEDSKDKYVVTDVSLKLSDQFMPRLDYPELQSELETESVLTAKVVSDAVIRIRKRKLPDPEQIGNVGSFFKNPIVTLSEFEVIKLNEPTVTGLHMPGNLIKLSAARLIDHAGLKGKRVGGAKVSEQHALVLTNHAHANYSDVRGLADLIVAAVKSRFGVSLETEPVFYT